MSTPRRRLHLAGVAYVAAECRRRGIAVRTISRSSGVDIVTDRLLTIAVRVSKPRVLQRRRRGQRYRYPGAAWCLHQHGAVLTDADLWVLLLLSAGGWRAWITPASALGPRKTAEVCTTPEVDKTLRGRPRTGTIRPYEDRWDLLDGAAEGKAA